MADFKCKCTNCSSILDVDEEKDAFICPVCGEPFVVEKARQKYIDEEMTEDEDTNGFVIHGGVLISYSGEDSEIVIPSNVVIIGENAFASKVTITSITIPDTVTRISDKAFNNCQKLREIDIPGSVSSVGDNVFENCTSLEKVVLGEGIVSIGDSIFRNCSNLSHVEFPVSLNYIGFYAFAGCVKLKNVDLKSGAKIETGAFDDCTQLTTDSKKDIIKNKRGCYIATCVYGSYSCPEVWTLRRYRDYKLGKTILGRLFIKTYYFLSPKIVKVFGKTNWFKKIWRKSLDKMVYRLNSVGYENTPYTDIDWN